MHSTVAVFVFVFLKCVVSLSLVDSLLHNIEIKCTEVCGSRASDLLCY